MNKRTKTGLSGALLALLIAVGITGCFSGCGTTANTAAYKAVAASWDGVATVKGEWDAYVASQAAAGSPVNVTNVAEVNAAYAKVKTSYLVACDAGAAWSAAVQTNAPATTAAGLQGVYSECSTNLAADVGDIEALIAQLKTTNAPPATVTPPATSTNPAAGKTQPRPTTPHLPLGTNSTVTSTN